MEDVLNWIIGNWGEILALLAALGTVATIICKLTPSPKDDAIVARILEWLKLVPKKK